MKLIQAKTNPPAFYSYYFYSSTKYDALSL